MADAPLLQQKEHLLLTFAALNRTTLCIPPFRVYSITRVNSHLTRLPLLSRTWFPPHRAGHQARRRPETACRRGHHSLRKEGLQARSDEGARSSAKRKNAAKSVLLAGHTMNEHPIRDL